MEHFKRYILLLILLVISSTTHFTQLAVGASTDDVLASDSVKNIVEDVCQSSLLPSENVEAELPRELVDGESLCTLPEEESDSLSVADMPRNDNYWKEQLMKGKLDLYDESIKYPSFLQMCVNLYRWGDRTFNSYDPEYVVGTGYKCKLFVKNEEWLDSYALRFPHKVNMGMMSNVSSNIGAYVQYMAVSVGYTREINALFGAKVSGQNKLEFQFTCSLFSAEVYYNKNTGSTNIHHFGKYNGGKWFTQEFNGLSSESLGADIYYFFNNKKYSQGAAYNFSKYQKKSAGSLIAISVFGSSTSSTTSLFQ